MSRRMSMRAAMDLVPDDLPDGAFFAMAEEMAGLEPSQGFDELDAEEFAIPTKKQRRDRPVNRGEHVERRPTSFKDQQHKPFLCIDCKRRFRLESGARMHWQQSHGEPR